MLVDLEKFIQSTHLEEPLYPGKRVVKPCKQVGDFKNHSVAFDWRTPQELKIEIKAGLTGKNLPQEIIRKYPVCFQMPTYVKIKVTNDNLENDEEEGAEEGKSKSSGGGGGGKKPLAKKKSLQDIAMIGKRFGDSALGKIPSVGVITEMVVLGMSIAQNAINATFAELTRQIGQAKVSATEILAKTGDMIKRVQPPAFLKPKGDETVRYKYDREKNADIGVKPGFG